MATKFKTIEQELFEAVCVCLEAEQERLLKLKPGSPASTYTARRISQIEAAVDRYRRERAG